MQSFSFQKCKAVRVFKPQCPYKSLSCPKTQGNTYGYYMKPTLRVSVLDSQHTVVPMRSLLFYGSRDQRPIEELETARQDVAGAQRLMTDLP